MNNIDINELVLLLAGTAVKPIFDDEVWQNYGYSKRPKKGSVLNKIFPKKFELENFISRELLIMGLIDILNSIKKSDKTFDEKLLISLGVIDQILYTTKHLFPIDVFMDNLFSAYAIFLKSDNTKLYEPVLLKAKIMLNKNNFAKFMVGTIKLFIIKRNDNYLLDIGYFKNMINSYSIENKLKVSTPVEQIVNKYGDIIAEKILKT